MSDVILNSNNTKLFEKLQKENNLRRNVFSPSFIVRLARRFKAKCKTMTSVCNTIAIKGRGGDAVFVKHDLESGREKKACYMFLTEALYNLGVGSKVFFERDAEGRLVTFSRGLGGSKNPQSKRVFEERYGLFLPNTKESLKAEGEAIGALCKFFALGDVKLGGKHNSKGHRKNYGIVRKVSPEGEAQSKIKIFDFLISSRELKPHKREMKLLEDLAGKCKLDAGGNFLPKQERAKTTQRASLEKVLEVSYNNALKTYAELYGKGSAAELELLAKYKRDLEAKLGTISIA